MIYYIILANLDIGWTKFLGRTCTFYYELSIPPTYIEYYLNYRKTGKIGFN